MNKEITATKKYYDKNAAVWTDRKSNSFHHEFQFKKFITYLSKNASILDIGCAGGIHVPLFLGLGRALHYTGLDISSSFLSIARRRYPQLSFLKGNILEKKSLPKRNFDGFFAGAVLMHVPFNEWDNLFSNIENICRPCAVGYITLPIEHPSGEQKHLDSRHFTILNARDQKQYLKKRNWKIVESGTLNGSSKESIWKWYIVKLP